MSLAGGEAFTSIAARIEDDLSSARSVEDLQDLLGADSILVHAAALQGQFILPDLRRALPGIDAGSQSPADVAVIGLGDAGHAVLARLGSGVVAETALRRLFLDIETSKPRELDENVVNVILEGAMESDAPPATSHGEVLRAAYRAASGREGLPPLAVETLEGMSGARITVHIVAGVEDPWAAVLPDLLFDLRALLGGGSRGRGILHLLCRPSPRLRGKSRTALEDLEKQKLFDDAFVVSAAGDAAPGLAAEFIKLSVLAPEVLTPRREGALRGAFSSYGMARAPEPPQKGREEYLSRLADALLVAVPSWLPSDVMLLERVAEDVHFCHAPDLPPPEDAWRLSPELIPVVLPEGPATLLRIQRGLQLADLRFF